MEIRKSSSLVCLMLLLALFFVGCEKNEVSEEFQIAVSPNDVIFNNNQTSKLFISVQPSGKFQWNVASKPDWIEINSVSGTIDSEIIELELTPNISNLDEGKYVGKVEFVTNGAGKAEVSLELNIEDLSNIMSVSKSSLNYGYSEGSLSFVIKNDGKFNFDWSWDNNSNSFLNLNPSSGSLSAGDSKEVVMTLDRANLVTQDYNLETLITNNFGQSITINVGINNYIEEKWLIDGNIIDAEYDRNNNVIVAVSENPNELRVFNPSNNSVKSVALNIPPTCVSVELGGSHAVVGHNGWFSYINLSTMELENNYAVTTNTFDIILAPNEWVYVFPKEDQWERIRCVNLANGVEIQHIGGSVWERTKVKLHPSGNYIYGADNGLSPSDFEKYDINNGTAQYLYDSPYHGDFAFNGDIWISEDGIRLFAKSRRVFNASTNQSNDMTYNGELVGEGNIMTLDFSSSAKKVYAIFTTGNSWDEIPSNEIRKYETDFLAFQGTIKLPGFFIPNENTGDKVYDSQGHFGFFNSDGTKYYVLVKVEEGTGAVNEWAITTIDVE
ncbi:hypothetical protein L3X37_09065 [Sabulilitoribacter arenilitoris]|uniref:BACON domain-containing protein n=1 Tax=Wocania arenilitoris TaxID=2044858 RepID=A0AAE3EN73_9FLAO|nr:hypothetical protein [Wocania arenilitoris]MCF7568513.1 hypothetical protein [Wocania arenilitoris]